jgi:16S rRNA (adenine1518-N6/adenine1519-N6)-dimethyltransferase
VSVEIDPEMRQLASEELFEFDNVSLLGQDALADKHTIAPEVLAAVDQQLAARGASRFKLVANLPYNVATPIIGSLLALERPPESMTVTIQKELADRITASPGTKAYGALSVWTQSQCVARQVRTLPPKAFWPRPKVTSAILSVRLDPELRGRIADREFFHRFVRALFCHRRKTLRGVLPGVCETICNRRLTKPEADALLARLNLPPLVRAEQMDIAALLALSDLTQAGR